MELEVAAPRRIADAVPGYNEAALAALGVAAGGRQSARVAIGFVDYGFDLLHPTLRDVTGDKSRFRFLWDQNRTPECARAAEFEVADTKDWDGARLDGEVRRAVASGSRRGLDAQYDPHANNCGRGGQIGGAHGTMMASMASGTAVAGFRGAAPAADLIGVQLALADHDWKEEDRFGVPTWGAWQPQAKPRWEGWRSYDDSRQIINAVRYIVVRAGALGVDAVVINLSIGAWAGSHDATSLVAREIGAVISDAEKAFAAGRGPRVIVVAGTGNAGADEGHWQGVVGSHEFTEGVPKSPPQSCHPGSYCRDPFLHEPGHGGLGAMGPGDEPRDDNGGLDAARTAGSSAFDWVMQRRDPTQNKLEIWAESSARLDVHLSLPDGRTIEIAPGATREILCVGHRIGIAEHTHGMRGQRSCVRILLHPPYFSDAMFEGEVETCAFTVRLTSTVDRSVEVHAWIERDDGMAERSWLSPSHAESTLCCLAAIPGAVVVGGYDHHAGTDAGWLVPLPASSAGPAPWAEGKAARVPHFAAPAHRIWGARSKSRGFIETTGTSAAVALTSGAIAHYLALHGAAAPLPLAAGVWSPRFGFGPFRIDCPAPRGVAA